jgi:UDP-N-acetyl-D-mannosaminuronic acid transferase (WecB/TagA/CpsF family)
MEIKFCKDCQHLVENAYCCRPDGISLVTGTVKYVRRAAESERSYDATGCGTTARYFTLKQI